MLVRAADLRDEFGFARLAAEFAEIASGSPTNRVHSGRQRIAQTASAEPTTRADRALADRAREKHSLLRDLDLADIKSPPSSSHLSERVYSSATGFLRTPTFSISTSTTSPGLRNTGGLRVKPTPAGVPVAMTSPGTRSKIIEAYSIRRGILKIEMLGVGRLHRPRR